MIANSTSPSIPTGTLPDPADSAAPVVVTEIELLEIATAAAEAATPGDVFALHGPLGAGKSTFCRRFVRHYAARHGEQVEDVPSPTFTLVQTYETLAATLWHFDLYRIGAPEEVWEIGFEEALNGGICLIEWPGNASGLLPDSRIDVALDHCQDPGARLLTLNVPADARERYDPVLSRLESLRHDH